MKSVRIYNGTVFTDLAAMEQCAVLIEDGLISDIFSQKRFEQRKFDDSARLIDTSGVFYRKADNVIEGSRLTMIRKIRNLATSGVRE